MTQAIFDRIASEEQLAAAWLRVKRNKGMGGSDDISIAAFEDLLADNLRALRRALAAGFYRPSQLLQIPIAKASGGKRPLAIPTVLDRVAQAAAAAVLDELFDPVMSDASFAYRRARSVQHAIGRVVTYRLWGFHWIVDGDVERFFETVPHPPLQVQLTEHLPCARTLRLIGLWFASFSRDGVGLAQGSPLSPLLANLYLTPVDHAIHSKRVKLVRFGDDFLLLTKSRAAAEWAYARMETLLAERGLRLNAAKTSVKSFADGLEFLGYQFTADGQHVVRAVK
jgi:CRISPR-associated protein Cas1